MSPRRLRSRVSRNPLHMTPVVARSRECQSCNSLQPQFDEPASRGGGEERRWAQATTGCRGIAHGRNHRRPSPLPDRPASPRPRDGRPAGGRARGRARPRRGGSSAADLRPRRSTCAPRASRRSTRACGRRVPVARDATAEELLDLIARLNTDRDVHGILVQLPLPKHLSATLVINAIDPRKDVDGFHISNVGMVGRGKKKKRGGQGTRSRHVRRSAA